MAAAASARCSCQASARRLVDDRVTRPQRSPQQIVVAAARQRRPQIERLVEAAERERGLAADGVAAAAAHAHRPGDQRRRPAVQRPAGVVRAGGSARPPARSRRWPRRAARPACRAPSGSTRPVQTATRASASNTRAERRCPIRDRRPRRRRGRRRLASRGGQRAVAGEIEPGTGSASSGPTGTASRTSVARRLVRPGRCPPPGSPPGRGIWRSEGLERAREELGPVAGADRRGDRGWAHSHRGRAAGQPRRGASSGRRRRPGPPSTRAGRRARRAAAAAAPAPARAAQQPTM